MVSFRPYLAGPPRCAALRLSWLKGVGICFLAATRAYAADLEPLVQAWLKAQPDLSSWSAQVRQTRHLQALTQPLVSQGELWFLAPNRFRWQLGEPPATIAIRTEKEMVVLYPRLRRAERYLLGETNPLQDSLALLDAGFPRSSEDLLGRFDVLEQHQAGDRFELVLQPRTGSARRLLPKIRIFFSTDDFTLRSTVLEFADGSVMQNEFTEVQINPELESGLFDPTIPEGFETIQPSRQAP